MSDIHIFLLGKFNLFFIVLIRIISCPLHNLIAYVLVLLTVCLLSRVLPFRRINLFVKCQAF